MKKIALATALGVFALLAPNAASARVVGALSIGWENTEFSYDNSYSDYCEGYCYLTGEDKESGPFISGAVAAPLLRNNDNWIVVGEGRIQSEKEEYSSDYYYDENGYESHDNVAHGAVHLAYHTEEWAAAGFYGIENDHGWDVQMAGLEGQLYLPNMTLDGAFAYGTHDGGTYSYDGYDAWQAQANMAYYLNDNWTFGVGVGYSSQEYDQNGPQTDLTTVGVSAEYWVPESNYSIRAAYVHGDASVDYANYYYGGSVDYSSDTIQVQFVLNFGTENARDRDQSGLGLSGADGFDLHTRLREDVGYFAS
ncbi:MAG: hypothetical protein JNM59_00755 [Hyphomonadaceae bacterium]|nr:hypothetical protein [Hyphomonadaceae bacterium]